MHALAILSLLAIPILASPPWPIFTRPGPLPTARPSVDTTVLTSRNWDDPKASERNIDYDLDFCHQKKLSGVYYVQLKSYEEPTQLCGRLWEKLARMNGICSVTRVHHCGEHETLKVQPEDGKKVWVVGWSFYATACDFGAVESSIYEATKPHVVNLKCVKED